MTRVSGVLCFLLIAGALPGGQVFANEAEPSSSTYRVRVTAPGFANKPIVGTLSPGICLPRGNVALALGLTGGLVGAAIGAIVAPGEKWDTVDHKSVRISISPLLGRHRRIGMLVTLRF